MTCEAGISKKCPAKRFSSNGLLTELISYWGKSRRIKFSTSFLTASCPHKVSKRSSRFELPETRADEVTVTIEGSPNSLKSTCAVARVACPHNGTSTDRVNQRNEKCDPETGTAIGIPIRNSCLFGIVLNRAKRGKQFLIS